MSLAGTALVRLELPCRDLGRQREFYGRVLGLTPAEGLHAAFRCGSVRLVLRPRGDALFAAASNGAGMGGGVLLAFPVEAAELDRWHRRMMMARVAVLEPPGRPPRALRVSDPEGNVVEFFVADGA